MSLATSNSEPALTEPLPGATALDWSPVDARWRALARTVVARYGSMLRTIAVSFLMFALMALQGVLLARLLGPKARGEYSAVVLYAQTLLYIGMVGAPLTLARRAAQNGCSLPLLRNAAMRYGLFTGCVSAAVVTLLSFIALPAEKRYLAPWCGLATLIMPIEHMRLAVMAIEHGRSSFRRFNFFRLAAQAAFPCLLAILMLVGGASLSVVVALTIVASLIGLAIQMAATPGVRPWKAVDPRPTVLVREGLPYCAENLVGHIYGRLDMLLVLWLVGDLAVQGLYAAAVPAAALMVVAGNALELFAFNAGSRAQRRLDRKKLILIGAGVALVQIASASVFAVLLKPLMLFVYGEKFREAVPFALALLPAAAIYGAAMVAEGYLRGRGRPGVCMRASAAGMVVMLIGVAIWFPAHHAISIPWAACLGRLVGLGWLVLAVVMDAPDSEPSADSLAAMEGAA